MPWKAGRHENWGIFNRHFWGVYVRHSQIRRRFRMLDGICPEAVELLKDTTCPMIVFEILREMAPIRQVEAAELMIGQNNFSSMFAKALLAATNEKQLVDPRKRKP
jgi:hypothetical protein